jgi:hypothetical protein
MSRSIAWRGLKYLIGSVVICGLSGCVATAPKSVRVSHDPLLARQGGVILLLDACVQRDIVGGGDYFVIKEVEAGAQATLSSLKKYIQDSRIPVREEVISVCGARLNSNNAAIRAADRAGGRVRSAQQPLKISETAKDDPEYVRALGLVSTYSFERAAVKPGAKKNFGGQPSGKEAPNSIEIKDFQAAAEVIKNRTQASSVLFLGILGHSRSGGKKAVQKIGSIAVGVTAGFLTAGLGTGYYLVFVPGFQIDGMMMESALIDLDSGQLTWSSAVQSTGDPIRPNVMSNPETIDLLFRDIIFKPVAVQPPSSTP